MVQEATGLVVNLIEADGQFLRKGYVIHDLGDLPWAVGDTLSDPFDPKTWVPQAVPVPPPDLTPLFDSAAVKLHALLLGRGFKADEAAEFMRRIYKGLGGL